MTYVLSNSQIATITYSTTDKPLTVGEYTATISYAGDNNYNAVEKIITINITKATLTVSVLNNYKFNHTITVESGVYSDEISKLMKDFFKELRETKCKQI